MNCIEKGSFLISFGYICETELCTSISYAIRPAKASWIGIWRGIYSLNERFLGEELGFCLTFLLTISASMAKNKEGQNNPVSVENYPSYRQICLKGSLNRDLLRPLPHILPKQTNLTPSIFQDLSGLRASVVVENQTSSRFLRTNT